MIDEEPNLVSSRKSLRVIIDGYPFSIEIYRLEIEQEWTLDIVDHVGTSHVWDRRFASDRDARKVAIDALETVGALVFMQGSNVVPFRKG